MHTKKFKWKSERNRDSPPHLKSGEFQALENEYFFFFPEEIVTEILSRLPVKSILKFRCVSKSWLSLISSKRFIKLHLNVSSKDSNPNCYQLIFLDPDPEFMFKQCSLRSILHEQNLTDVVTIDYPLKCEPKYVDVVGYCNGLICIVSNSYRGDLFLWNPAIRKVTELPSTDRKLKSIYGFGFDESNDDYKVVGIFSSFDGGELTSMVKIYSLKNNSWKRIEDFKGGFPLYKSCKYTNGKIYWVNQPFTVPLDFPDIVSLDLANEVYEIVEQPNYGCKYRMLETVFGVLDGCICVLCNPTDTRVDLWVLKERGVEGSWSKVFAATNDFLNSNLLGLEPICTLPSGEILFLFRPFFVVFDQRINSFRFYDKMDLCRFMDAYMHTESLVSPAANGSVRSQHQL